MTTHEIAAQLALWITTTYPTGIAWMEHEDGTITVDWVDDSSTQITITIRNTAPTVVPA